MSEQQPEPASDLAPRPNQILSQPDTVEQCRTELRTPQERILAAGAARDQFALTRAAAGGNSR
jgi:hypothetical protein